MKEIKTGTVLLLIVLLFAAFCAGLYIGKQQRADGYLIITQKQEPVQETAQEKGETTQTTEATTLTGSVSEQVSGSTEPTEPTEPSDTRINLNTATKEELMTLPGIGEVLAQRILAFRDAYGPFETVDELDLVEGIGKKTIDKLRDMVTTGEG